MKNIFLALLLLTTLTGTSQFIKAKAINLSVGYGFSSSTYESENAIDHSFYLQGEYVYILSNFLDLRPYAGIILTEVNGKDIDGHPTTYKSTTNAFVFGGKTRLTIPASFITWLTIYLETGIGASWGKFENYTPNGTINKNGIIMHVPATLGFVFGEKRKFSFAPTFYFHNSIKQSSVGLIFGMNFPIDKN